MQQLTVIKLFSTATNEKQNNGKEIDNSDKTE